MYTMEVLSAHRDQKTMSDPLELQLQAVVNHLMWGWDSNSGPHDGVASALCLFQDKVSLCGPGCPVTCSVDQSWPQI